MTMRWKVNGPYEELMKATGHKGKYSVGTVRTHGGVKKRKMADGSWQPVMHGKKAKAKKRRATIDTRTPALRYYTAQREVERGAKKRDDGWAIKYAEAYAAAMNKHGVNAKVWQKKTGKGTVTRVYFFGTFIDMSPTGFTSETDDSTYKLAHLWQNSRKKIASGEAEYARSKTRKALDRQREAEGDEAFRLIHEMHGTSDVDPFASASKVDPAVTRESEMIEAAKTGKLTQTMGELYPGITWSDKEMSRIRSLLKVDPAEAGEYAAYFGEKHARKSHVALTDLLKAGGHKYISRKPDGKGGWLYDYGRGHGKPKGRELVEYGAYHRPVASSSTPAKNRPDDPMEHFGTHPDFKHGTVRYTKPLTPEEAHAKALSRILSPKDIDEAVDAIVVEETEFAQELLEEHDEEGGRTSSLGMGVRQYIRDNALHVDSDMLIQRVADKLRDKESRKSHGGRGLSPLSKGKKYPVGTVRTHGGVKKRKTAQGWKPVESQKAPKKRAKVAPPRRVNDPGVEWGNDLDRKNADGTVTIYHRTTAEGAKGIIESGTLSSKMNDRAVYFSTRDSGQASGYGDRLIAVDIDPGFVELDDEFPDGEAHVTVSPENQQKVQNIRVMPTRQAEGVAEALMDRAARILQYVDESEAVKLLLDDGYTTDQAFLAVKAGKLLNKFRQERRKSHGGVELSEKAKSWHLGDPCIYCGTPHDDVPPGPCDGNLQWYEKGRKNLPVGSRRTRKDGRTYVKQKDGEWRLVEEQKKKRGRPTKKKGPTSRKRAQSKKPTAPQPDRKRAISAKDDPNKAAIRLARLVGAEEGAKRLGVSEEMFRKWAHGKAPVPAKHHGKLEKIFSEAKLAEKRAESGQEGQEEYKKKRSRKPMRDDPRAEREGLRWQSRMERALQPFMDLVKAIYPPGHGWEPIRRPRGAKVGYRRRKGSGKGYNYFYPGAFTGTLGKEGRPVNPKKKKKKKGTQKERHTGIATTTEQIRSKYGHLGVGNVPVDSDRVDKDGNVVKKAVDFKKVQFVDLNPADPSTKPCFKWKDFSVNPPEGKWKYGRARTLGQRNARDKFDRVSKLLPNMRGIGAALAKVVSDEGASQDHRDAAAAIAIMADTGTRIGHIKHLKSSGTRGALTLLGKDIRISKAGVFLEFSGKGGKKNVAEITNPAVAKYLRERVRGVAKDDRVFSCTLRDMENVRDKAGYGDHIFHDFRTARATILAADELASSPSPPPPLPKNKAGARALIMERVSAASIVVANQLNNTPGMALESYIHPSVIWAYIQDVGGKDVAESFFKKGGDYFDELAETKGGARLLRVAMSLKMPGPRGAKWDKEDQEIQPDVMDSYPLPAGLF